MNMSIHRWQYRSWWMVVVMFIMTSVVCAQDFAVSDPVVVLGSFSAGDPGENLLTVGETQFTFQTESAWRLLGQLNTSVRRLEDGLEMPMERARLLFPDVGEDFASFRPFQLDYGQGGPDIQSVNFDWSILQQRVQDYLEPSDPPGLYQCDLLFALESRDGQPLADPLSVIFEFNILPWLELELPVSGIEFTVDDQHSDALSEVFPVVVRTNGPWILTVAMLGDLTDSETGEVIEYERLDWTIPSGSDWESLIPEFVPVSLDPTLVARGQALETFVVTEVTIPMQMRCGALGLMSGGRFGADLDLTARIEMDVR